MNQNPPSELTTPRTGGASGQTASSSTSSSSHSQTGSSVVSQAKESAGHVAHVAREQVQSRLESQKERAVGKLEGMANALRSASQQMRAPQTQKGFPQYIEKTADQIDRVSSYLQTTTVADMVDDVERFARRQPTMFLGSTFLIGLLGARLLKSSARPQQPEQADQPESAQASAEMTRGELPPARPPVSTAPVVSVGERTDIDDKDISGSSEGGFGIR